MDKYEYLSMLGEGAYGKVMKCRHKQSGRLVAIKKFVETEEDLIARKVALREIRMLKQMTHDNLVHLFEVFRRKNRFHLVFEYVETTLLSKIEDEGYLSDKTTRGYAFQISRALDFCHSRRVVHRDLKPENVLISNDDVVKLCDFGFARFVADSESREPMTDYVATRWYRAPELLVGDPNYGTPVDVWALGAIVVEMLSGEAMFPGESDIDTVHKITSLLGPLTTKQAAFISTDHEKLEANAATADHLDSLVSLQGAYPFLDGRTLKFVSSCLKMDPVERPKVQQLLTVAYFTWDSFPQKCVELLKRKLSLRKRQGLLISKHLCPPGSDSAANTAARGSFKGAMEPTPVVHVRSLGRGSSVSFEDFIHPSIEIEPNTAAAKPLKPEISALSQATVDEPVVYDVDQTTVKFKQFSMPKTIRIVPLNGRLIIDDNERYCTEFTHSMKPTPDDFCLPSSNFK